MRYSLTTNNSGAVLSTLTAITICSATVTTRNFIPELTAGDHTLDRRRITWLSTVQQDLKQHHLMLPEAADLAQNRPLWRMMSTYAMQSSELHARNDDDDDHILCTLPQLYTLVVYGPTAAAALGYFGKV